MNNEVTIRGLGQIRDNLTYGFKGEGVKIEFDFTTHTTEKKPTEFNFKILTKCFDDESEHWEYITMLQVASTLCHYLNGLNLMVVSDQEKRENESVFDYGLDAFMVYVKDRINKRQYNLAMDDFMKQFKLIIESFLRG